MQSYSKTSVATHQAYELDESEIDDEKLEPPELELCKMMLDALDIELDELLFISLDDTEDCDVSEENEELYCHDDVEDVLDPPELLLYNIILEELDEDVRLEYVDSDDSVMELDDESVEDELSGHLQLSSVFR